MRLARGTPVGRAGVVELRNQHATYAITWSVFSPRLDILSFEEAY